MPVIGHDAVRDEVHRMPLEALPQHLQKGAIIAAPVEERSSADGSVHDVEERGVE